MSDSESSSGSSSGSVDANDITRPDVAEKYRFAGEYVTYALKHVVEAAKAGASVLDLCKLGDQKIIEKTSSVFNKPILVDGKKQKMDKGVAFPTSVTRNNGLSNFSPREGDTTKLADGDVVKIELGCHLNGYIVTAAQTIVVGEQEITDRKADVVTAAYNGLLATIRNLKPGTKSTTFPETIAKVATAYGVSTVEDVAHCFTTKQFVIEASKQVAIKAKPEDRTEEFTVEEGDVFTLEIAFTTGEDGKVSNKDGIVTIFKRAVDVNYMLKLKNSRALFSEINSTYPSLPFNVRTFEAKLGAGATKLGLKEILEHNLLNQYPVLVDKPDQTIALFKTTCLVLDNSIVPLTLPTLPSNVKSSKTLPEDLKTLIDTPLKKSAPKKKKAAKKTDDKAEAK